MDLIDLMKEAENDGIKVVEMNFESDADGLCLGNKVAIRSSLTNSEKKCVLAEEIGHIKTTVGNILNTKDMNKYKQERKARIWAYQKLLNIDMIIDAASKGYTETYDMAEYLNIDEKFLKDYLIWQGILDISL